MTFGSDWGTGRQKAERMAPVAKDFQNQRKEPQDDLDNSEVRQVLLLMRVSQT